MTGRSVLDQHNPTYKPVRKSKKRRRGVRDDGLIYPSNSTGVDKIYEIESLDLCELDMNLIHILPKTNFGFVL
ncbi:hypothetical protein MJO28_003857 [Puccinia striiformis f. sp. tritici]|uniref:Uncharacterized protein n=1 Tax=Puccinia striiformis f. sp. tritici TaxID=168172 RepID=A0ACC0EME0_9BASI|nr:hypothetical protein MJO28_003857 [Puccinia striiformis f. sp. tritici]